MPGSLKIKYLVFILLVITGYFILFFADLSQTHTLCLFKNITGFPCPACGSTRATVLLLHGRIIPSVLLNPLGIVTNALILFCCFKMVSDIRNNRSTLLPLVRKKWNTWLIIAFIMVIVANWIWNICKEL